MVDDVIPTISACIINTIFPIMTWLDLDSLGQITTKRLDLFTNRLPLFTDQSIATFWPSDFPIDQSIATFQASNFQSQVYSSDCYFIPSDCSCVLADITKQLPRVPSDCSPYPSDCLAYPSDCLLCAVTKHLLLLGKRLLAGRYKFSSFYRDTYPLPIL